VTREWSPRFDHGYSQVIDWFYKLDVMTDTADMESRLGKRSVDYTGVLIVGRDHHKDAGEPLRLRWRHERTIVNSKRIVCVTYDQLLDDLTFRLDLYALAAQAGG
jgi:ketosteroid isomerase-like protein